MSGYEATKLYRMAHLDEPRLPIIALTADATTETERLCRDAGMDAVLTKPVDAEQLLLALDETVGKLSSPPSAASLLPSPAAAPPPAGPGLIRTDAPSTVTPITIHPRFPTDPPASSTRRRSRRCSPSAADDYFATSSRRSAPTHGRFCRRSPARPAEGDIRAFREHAHSLRSWAANVGGARLCNTLLSLRDVTARASQRRPRRDRAPRGRARPPRHRPQTKTPEAKRGSTCFLSI